MKRLHIFLLKSFIGPFLITFLIAVFLLLMQFLWKYIDDLVGKGLEFNHIAELLFYASARFVPIALPIAILISSVMVFGKLAEQYELVALKSSGISLYRIMIPCLFFSIILAYGSFLFSNYIMPIANLENASMIYQIQKKRPSLNIKEGIFYNDIEGFYIKVGKKNEKKNILKDILIYNQKAGHTNNHVITAKKGRMKLTDDEKFLEITLYNGHSYLDVIEKTKNKSKPFRTTHFKKNIVRIDLAKINTSIDVNELYKGHYAMLNNTQLANAMDSLELIYEQKKNSFKSNIMDKYKTSYDTLPQKDEISNTKQNLKQEQQKYNIAINKIRSLKAMTRSNKNNLEYKKIIISRHKIEWHRKVSLAVTCILFFLVGAPLGSIIKKGGFGVPVLISVLFFVCYHIINMIGEKSARELTLEPYQGMWLANITCIPIAFFLIYRAKNDSKFFNLRQLNILINRLKKHKK